MIKCKFSLSDTFKDLVLEGEPAQDLLQLGDPGLQAVAPLVVLEDQGSPLQEGDLPEARKVGAAQMCARPAVEAVPERSKDSSLSSAPRESGCRLAASFHMTC